MTLRIDEVGGDWRSLAFHFEKLGHAFIHDVASSSLQKRRSRESSITVFASKT